MAQTVKVTKWGNSLGIRIPTDIARQFRIKAHDRIKVTYTDNQIIYTVRPNKHERMEAYFEELHASGVHPDD